MAPGSPIKIASTPADKMLEGAAVLILALTWIYVIVNYDSLPEIIPTHFNGAGEIDNYGSRSAIFALPAMATGVAVLFFVIQLIPPAHLNYPGKMKSAAHDGHPYRNVLTLLRFLKIGIGLFSFLMVIEVIQIATGKKQSLGPYTWAWLGILLFLPLGIFLFRSMREKKS